MLSFCLNSEELPRDISAVEAHCTVLEYLRATGVTGTKEGCATGDCGACTAVLAWLTEDGKLKYESVNTCIALVPHLHGKLLITVDGLAINGKLHPVQQAMVAAHGSQCGFCTPGFVMSLFAHYCNGCPGGREEIIHRLSGNLCRCTGYRPIVEAALTLSKRKRADYYSKNASKIKRKLKALSSQTDDELLPTNLNVLSKVAIKRKSAQLIAGGTDLSLSITQQLAEPELIFIDKVKQLQTIKTTKQHWLIGAGANWQQVTEQLGSLDCFNELMERFGSPQIRARATVGGNIANASPIADGPPVFLALGCELTLRNGSKRRKVDLKDYYTGYKQTVLGAGELIESIKVNRLAADAKFAVYKISKRREDDISAVCGAFMIRLSAKNLVTKAQIAFGGMAAIPQRATNCEAVLVGKRWELATITKAKVALNKEFSPITDVRASAEYRSIIARELLQRFYYQTTNTAGKQLTQVTPS